MILAAEVAEPDEPSDSTDRPESPTKKQATEQPPPRDHHDCVICGQNAPSTAERPFGYVVLLQASSGMYCDCQLVKFFCQQRSKGSMYGT